MQKRLRRAARWFWAALGVVTSVGALRPAVAANTDPAVIWTMINVNAGTMQGDAHLLELPDGRRVMIDVSSTAQPVLETLIRKNISFVDVLYLSHLHKDHYAALPALLDHGIRFGKVILNTPEKSVCDTERPWGCDWADIQELLNRLKLHKVTVETARAGDVLRIGAAGDLTVLYTFNGLDSPIGPTDVNDTSLIMKLHFAGWSALFTGDLNRPLGAYLAQNGNRLRADVLKVPHHGTDGLAPDEFFKTVNASAALVPSPAHLWNSARSARARGYFERRPTPVFVGGEQGTITVTFDRNGVLVHPERGADLRITSHRQATP